MSTFQIACGVCGTWNDGTEAKEQQIICKTCGKHFEVKKRRGHYNVKSKRLATHKGSTAVPHVGKTWKRVAGSKFRDEFDSLF